MEKILYAGPQYTSMVNMIRYIHDGLCNEMFISITLTGLMLDQFAYIRGSMYSSNIQPTAGYNTMISICDDITITSRRKATAKQKVITPTLLFV